MSRQFLKSVVWVRNCGKNKARRLSVGSYTSIYTCLETADQAFQEAYLYGWHSWKTKSSRDEKAPGMRRFDEPHSTGGKGKTVLNIE